jgi:hypothetical protein
VVNESLPIQVRLINIATLQDTPIQVRLIQLLCKILVEYHIMGKGYLLTRLGVKSLLDIRQTPELLATDGGIHNVNTLSHSPNRKGQT